MTRNDARTTNPSGNEGRHRSRRWTRWRRAAGFLGVAVAVPFFLWLPLGWFGLVPSMIDVFGIAGLRIPASITVGGLLLAAVGFYDF